MTAPVGTSASVAVYTPFYFPDYVGGGERLAQLTAAGLRANGADVSVVTTGKQAGAYEYDGTAVEVIPSGSNRPEALAVAFRKLKPAIVHMVGAWGTKDAGAAAHDAGARFGVAALDYGQFCDNHRLIRGDGTICAGRTSEADCFRCTLEGERTRDQVLAYAGSWLPPTVSSAARKAGALYKGRAIGRQLHMAGDFRQREEDRHEAASRFDLFVAPTRFALEATTPFLDSRTRRAQLMYPVANDLLRPEPKRTSPDRLVVGFVGRCLPMKGLHVLMDTVESLSSRMPIELHVETATNGDEERYYWQPLKERATRLSFVRWREQGALGSADLREFHRKVDVLAVPSLWPEYLGFVTIEALALGTPVVVSDFASQREFVSDMSSGSLVPPGDMDALAATLRERWAAKQSGSVSATRSPALNASEYARRLLDAYKQAGA